MLPEFTASSSQPRSDRFQIPKKSAAEWKHIISMAREKAQNDSTLQPPDNCPNDGQSYILTLALMLKELDNVRIIKPELYVGSKYQLASENLILSEEEAEEMVANTFQLNFKQKMAYTIVAGYIARKSSGQLRMHLGGMGGTGKSQVIKALVTLLAVRNEHHRFLVIAPTGSTAALVNGSTYHSVLGFYKDKQVATTRLLNKVYDTFQHINIIFLDEVSMVSCYELCKISTHLSTALNTHLDSFGGKHMILAGDFAQLLPAAPGSLLLYSSKVAFIFPIAKQSK